MKQTSKRCLSGRSCRVFWKELLAQASIAWPLCVAMLFQYFLNTISISFCSHIGKTELAATCMAMSVICILVQGVGRGLAFGGDTFFAQTYGSNEKKNVGIYLQKGIIFTVLWTLPITGLLLNIDHMLLLLGQNPDVARLAQIYINYFLPGVWAFFCFFMVIRYLVCQSKVFPVMIVSLAGCGANIALNIFFMYELGMGMRGSAVALCLTFYLELFMCVLYIWVSGIYKETWTGWSFKCLENWSEFARVTTFSTLLCVLYWVATEIGTYTGGVFSKMELSAFSISFQMEAISASVFLALGGACTARMGQFLGANKPKMAAKAAYVSIIFAVVLSVVLAVLCYTLRYYIPQIFTYNKSVIDYTASVLQLTALFLGFEGIGLTAMGIVRGTGKQAVGSGVIFVAWFIIAWPIGIPLMLLTKLGLLGLWTSFIVGMVFQDVFVVTFVMTINWKQQAEQAVRRASAVCTTNKNIEVVFNNNNNKTEVVCNNNYINESREITITESSSLLKQDAKTIKRYGISQVSQSWRKPNNSTNSYSKNKLALNRLLILWLFTIPLILGTIKRLSMIQEESSEFNDINTTLLSTNSTQYEMTTPFLSTLGS